jgi:hypothetical protein
LTGNEQQAEPVKPFAEELSKETTPQTAPVSTDTKTDIERRRQEALESEKYRIVESSELYQDNKENYYKIQKLANGKTKVVFADENGVTQAQMGEYSPEVSLDTIFNGDENIYGSRKGDSRLTLTKIKDLKFTNKIVDKINAKYDAELAALEGKPETKPEEVVNKAEQINKECDGVSGNTPTIKGTGGNIDPDDFFS